MGFTDWNVPPIPPYQAEIHTESDTNTWLMIQSDTNIAGTSIPIPMLGTLPNIIHGVDIGFGYDTTTRHGVIPIPLSVSI